MERASAEAGAVARRFGEVKGYTINGIRVHQDFVTISTQVDAKLAEVTQLYGELVALVYRHGFS
jgi:hypothetical protein